MSDLKSKITTLIVDVENVLRDGDIKDIPKHFEKIGINASRLRDALHGRTELPSYFLECRLGKIPAREFRNAVRNDLLDNAMGMSDEDFDRAYCGIYEDKFFVQNFMTVSKIRSLGVKTVILSNNNPIHTAYFHEQCDDYLGQNALSEIFDAVLFSYEIGCRKPDKAAYQKALDAVGETDFSKCALADDKKKNLDAAAALGMTPVLIPTPGDFVKVIEGRFGI
jgi:putative hydrolase of the HAD superfamily